MFFHGHYFFRNANIFPSESEIYCRFHLVLKWRMICFSTFSLSKTKDGWLDVHFTLALMKKNSHKFYCCFRKLSDGFHFLFRYYDHDYGGCSMEILGLKIPLFLDFVKSRKNCLYLRERKRKKLNGQVKKSLMLLKYNRLRR